MGRSPLRSLAETEETPQAAESCNACMSNPAPQGESLMMHGIDPFPKLNVSSILIDVDGTITYSDEPEAIGGEVSLVLLAALVAEKEDVSREEALRRIREAGDPESVCLFSLLPRLNISREEYWERLQGHLSRYLKLYEDAAILLKALSAKGFRVFPASANSRMSILSKLAVFGLATIDGSPYLAEILGGSEICPGGKSSPEFFLMILRKYKLNPDKTLLIGDDPEFDLAFARAAGIEQVVLARRNQKEALVREADGGLYVNSLEWVLKML